jgi:hypothetical protein
MAWNPYGLDQIAHRLVKDALALDENGPANQDKCLREAYDMREAVAYGLERFWGESLRDEGKLVRKATYWRATWAKLVEILAIADVTLPNHSDPTTMAQMLWGDVGLDGTEGGARLTHKDRQLALAVLAQLCNCMVWWTQRYKSLEAE